MADYAPSPVGIGTLIPHFFFDVIGRMIPGTYLLAGAHVLTFGRPPEGYSRHFLNLFYEGGATGAVLLFLAFLALAYFVGFYLGSLSHLVERLLAKKWPWKETDIPQQLRRRTNGQARLEVSFSGDAWFPLPQGNRESDRVNRFAELCGYRVWAVNPNLGILGSRWDAEALASCSVLLASVLLGGSWLVCKWRVIWTAEGIGLAALAAIGVAALLCYRHYRRRTVPGKFALVQALPPAQRA